MARLRSIKSMFISERPCKTNDAAQDTAQKAETSVNRFPGKKLTSKECIRLLYYSLLDAVFVIERAAFKNRCNYSFNTFYCTGYVDCMYSWEKFQLPDLKCWHDISFYNGGGMYNVGNEYKGAEVELYGFTFNLKKIFDILEDDMRYGKIPYPERMNYR